MYKQKILILGGSTEGFLLAEKINQKYQGTVETITSFAGITETRRTVVGKTRVGGFGGGGFDGVEGLRGYLRSEHINIVLDATHPFAAKMKKNADEAVEQVEAVALIHIMRRAWQPLPSDEWLLAGDIEQAAHSLNAFAKHKTVFLAVGRKELAAFQNCQTIDFIARVIDPPKLTTQEGLPPKINFIVARGPFDLEAERTLFDRYEIAALVCKNSGGKAAAAKLQVARERKIPVVMVRRPEAPKGACVQSVDAAMKWLEERL